METTATSTDGGVKLRRIGFGIAFAVTALLVFIGVIVGLPTRYAPVDVGAAILGALDSAAAVALLIGWKHAAKIARAASAVSIALGVLVIALLASAAGYLKGAYGTLGQGGALIFLFVIVMIFPYTIAMPIACMLFVGPAPKKEAPAPKPSAPVKKKGDDDVVPPDPAEEDASGEDDAESAGAS